MLRNNKIIDSHTHAFRLDGIKHLIKSAESNSFEKFCINSCSCFGVSYLKQNLICALAKITYPGKIYAFGGLFYPDGYRNGKGEMFFEQAVRLRNIGFDGMKMLEGKPDMRKKIGLPLDSDLYDKYFSYLEAEGIPVTYHVGDPRMFWDIEKAPDWAVREGWVIQMELLYQKIRYTVKLKAY
jgi:hypothetical protein